jgi:hypothetical protein
MAATTGLIMDVTPAGKAMAATATKATQTAKTHIATVTATEAATAAISTGKATTAAIMTEAAKQPSEPQLKTQHT